MNDDTPSPENPEDFIQFHNDEERALFTEARLGQEALDFLSTPLGQLLQGRAEAEIEEAKAMLLTIDPYFTSEVEKWQIKAQVANQFIRWIGEAIQNGRHAELQLENYAEEND